MPVILSLIRHEYTDIISYDYVKRCFMRYDKERSTVDGVKLRGITKLLTAIFWPNYRFKRDHYSTTTGVNNNHEGLSRGSLVHRQMRDYFNLTKEQFESIHENPHVFTEKLMRALTIYHLTPVIAEFPIYDRRTKVATAIDAIAVDRNRKLCIIEFKSGMDHYLNKGNAPMNGPLAGLYSNCPLHQAWLQLLLELVILERNYKLKITDVLAYVIVVNLEGVVPYELPCDMIERRKEIYEYFVRHQFILHSEKEAAAYERKKTTRKRKR